MDWFSDTEKVRAPLKITYALQRSLFALTFVQLTEIAYLSHFSWPHQIQLQLIAIADVLGFLPASLRTGIAFTRIAHTDCCPLLLQKRTNLGAVRLSAKCHKETHA